MRNTINNIIDVKLGLEILLLVFRTSRILTETGLRLNLFLDLWHNCFPSLRNTLHAAWIAQLGLTILTYPYYIYYIYILYIYYIYIYIYIYLYTYISRDIHINILSCKTSSWHFGESFEKFEKFCCGKMLKYIQ